MKRTLLLRCPARSSLHRHEHYAYRRDDTEQHKPSLPQSTMLLLATSASSKPTHASGPYSCNWQAIPLSVTFINRVLAAYHSPAAGKGAALYALGVKYGIDPAFALAFFLPRIDDGYEGRGKYDALAWQFTLYPGCGLCEYVGQQCQAHQSCYAAFPTWEAGFEAWYKLIRDLYVRAWGLTTVDEIIPRYAPTADHNDEV